MMHFLCALRDFVLLLCRVLTVLSLMAFVWCLLAWEQISVWPIVLTLSFAIGFGGPGFCPGQLVSRLVVRKRLTVNAPPATPQPDPATPKAL